MNKTFIKRLLLPVIFILNVGLSLFAGENLITPAATPEEQIQAVQELIQRRAPAVADAFALTLIPQDQGQPVFELESIGDKIAIRGSSGIALASGWNWYLKNICHKQMSWCGSNMAMTAADIKPLPDRKFRQVMPHQCVPYMNYCTLSYSMVWWDWERWQWEIDYMAMNGVTMPLNVLGIEGAWYNAMIRVGLNDLEARSFLSAPSYQAWQWMQNIDSAGGPLPKSWIDSHVELGKKTLARQRSFGMTPIQQGFSGHVPRAFIDKFPKAKIRLQPDWCGFPGVAQLEPLDPFFAEFGKVFMEEEGKLFGLGGYYAADPFHESQPPKDISKEDLPKYLDNVGKSIFAVFDRIDPKATWVMQAWTLHKDIVCAVPKGRLILLDLASSRWNDKPRGSEGLWGHQFTTGTLHNMGARIEMHGDLADIAKNKFLLPKSLYPKGAIGTGFFMEGIIQNPVVYDLYFDLMSKDQPVKLEDWIPSYLMRRYGVKDGPAAAAWAMMITKGPYRPGSPGRGNGSIICARPALNVVKSGPVTNLVITYKPEDLLTIWGLLLQDQERCKDFDGYRFDVADVGRQVLSYYAQEVHQDLRSAFFAQDKEAFARESAKFQDLLREVDRLCETRGEYRYGDWVAAARKWGKDDAEADYFDKSASMILTLWGPEKNPVVNADYSWREWSGLIREYYLPRWQMLHAMLAEKMAKGEYFAEELTTTAPGDRPGFRAGPFYSKMADFELKWLNTPKRNWQKLDVGSGDEVKVSQAAYLKWNSAIETSYRELESKKQQRLLKGGQQLFAWEAKDLAASAQESEVDLAKLIDGNGQYAIEFRHLKGQKSLFVEAVTLCKNGAEVNQDKHLGKVDRDFLFNVYRVKLSAYDQTAKYTLKIKWRSEAGGSHSGLVFGKKIPGQ